jgi:hypothetical protein
MSVIARAFKAKNDYVGLDEEDLAFMRELLLKNPELLLEKPFDELISSQPLSLNEIQAEVILAALRFTEREGYTSLVRCVWTTDVLAMQQSHLVEQLIVLFPKLREKYA